MIFKSKEELNLFLKTKTSFLNAGSEGETYTDFKNAYKIYFDYEEASEDFAPVFDKDTAVKLKDIHIKTFAFPTDIITVKDMLAGIVMNYCEGLPLYEINPLTVPLNLLIKALEKALNDIKFISHMGLVTDDVMYNILLGKSFFIVDTLGYRFSEKDSSIILRNNVASFNYGIMLFLINDFFDDIIKNDNVLKEMYETKGKDLSLIFFVKYLVNYLSTLVGEEIKTLADAKKYIRYSNENQYKYLRKPFLKSYR